MLHGNPHRCQNGAARRFAPSGSLNVIIDLPLVERDSEAIDAENVPPCTRRGLCTIVQLSPGTYDA